MTKSEIDLKMIDAEAEYAQEVRDNPEEYEVTEDDIAEIEASLKPIETFEDIEALFV